MKNILKKAWLGLLLVVMTMALAGCSEGDGATVDTTLTINKDMSGERTMIVTLNSKAFDSHFNGTIDDLDALITSTCPSDITWTREGDGSSSIYTAKIEFSSVQDYKDKVENILGEETTLEISAPDSVWASGFMAHEAFSSPDLLESIKSATVNAGYVSSDYTNEMLSDNSYNAVYDGKLYESGSYGISIDEIVSLPLNSISEYTDLHSDNTYDRKFEFDIPLSSMEQKETEITEYMEGLATDGATSSWEDEDASKMFIVEKKGMDAEGLKAYTNAILDSDQCSLDLTAGDQSEAFTFSTLFDERQDYSSYISGDGGSIQVSYYVKPDNGVKVLDSYYGMEYTPYDDEDYIEVWWDYISSSETNLILSKTYTVKAINSTIALKGGNKVDKTDEFVFDEIPNEDDQTKMVEALNTKRDDALSVMDIAKDMTLIDPSIESTLKDDTFRITIKQNGPVKSIELNDSLFYSGATLEYLSQKSNVSPRVRYMYNQYCDMSNLASSLSDDFLLTCKVKNGLFGSWNKPTKKKESSDNTLGTTYKGGTVTITSDEPVIEFSGQGSRWNLPGMILWLIVVLAIIVAVIVCIILKVPAKIKAHMAESKAREDAIRAQAMAAQQMQQGYQAQQPQQGYQAQQPQQGYQTQHTQTQDQQQVPTQPVMQQSDVPTSAGDADSGEYKFCRYCGTKLAKDAAFCNNCGQKQ